jgi:hypothetical protein
MSRRLFWPLIALASVLGAAAAASFAIAAFSDPLPGGTVDYTPYAPSTSTEVFDRSSSLDWSADRGLLIAAMLLAAFILAAYGLAARMRWDR